MGLAEAVKGAGPMLPHPRRQVRRHADIERAVPPAGHDIGGDKGAMGRHSHNLYDTRPFVIHAPSHFRHPPASAARPGDPAARESANLSRTKSSRIVRRMDFA